MATSPSSSSSSLVVLGTAEPLDTATSSRRVGVESWPAAENFRSTLVDASLHQTSVKYELPKEYTILAAKDCPPCTPPPEDSNLICVYESMMEVGIRFPLHDFYAKILRHFNLAPSQLFPNAWLKLSLFVRLCQGLGVEPTKAVFRHFFKCAHIGEQDGWYYFVPYSTSRNLFKFLVKLPSHRGWQKRFFFLDSTVPWRCPKKWGRPGTAAFDKPVLNEQAMVTISKLEEVKDNKAYLRKLLLSTLPVIQRELQMPPLKTEAATRRSSPTRERKRKSLEDNYDFSGKDGQLPSSPPVQQAAIPGSSSPTPSRASSSANRDELSKLFHQLMQQNEEDLNQAKEQLREAREKHAVEVTRLKDELDAAKWEHSADVSKLKEELEAEKAKHAAMISKLTDELQAASARHVKALGLVEVEQGKVRQLTVQLQERNADMKVFQAAQAQHSTKIQQLTAQLQAARAELEALKSQHADEVKAIKVECQNKMIDAEHKSNMMLSERYTQGLRHMRDLVLELYSSGIDASLLTPEALIRSVPPKSHPLQAPEEQ